MKPGDKLGPYEILAPIGKGGMGEVWKARDPRVGRDVAIKVSQEDFSERFDREARAIGALNHPNICTLYDVGPNYLVMEYVEGTPLKGPLPLDQALKYAAQICDALDAAHKKGITHRDLKPANILVTKAGIKLLDFGLAKLASAKLGPSLKADDATLTMALTGKNEIVGTLYYMSPEQLQVQANGQEIDGRSDIFSFGIVLYEMLTGKRAFEGASPASVIAAIMERPAPSISDIAPPALDRVLKKCLAKDPDDRWQTAWDLKSELDWIASGASNGFGAPAQLTARSRSSFGYAGWITAGVLAISLGGVSWIGHRATTRPTGSTLQQMVRLDVDLGPDVRLGGVSIGGGGPNAVLSPDGARLVYLSLGRLFTRRLDESNVTELTGTEGASSPFFSPDGQWIGFFAQATLKKISVSGGAAVTLCVASTPRGASWGEDGNIIALLTSAGPLWRIPSSGGEPTQLTQLAPGEVTHRWPQVLPGNKAVLFTSNNGVTGFDAANIEVLTLADGRRKTLVQGGTFGRYVPTGHLLYMNKGKLFAVPFDLDHLEVRGRPEPVLDGFAYSNRLGYAQVDFARNGTLVYQSGRDPELVTMQWVDSTGNAQPLLTKPDFYTNPSLSPDGLRLATYTIGGANSDIWVYEMQRDTMTRLTFGDGSSIGPIWSPDGRYVVYTRQGTGMFWTRADGAGKPQPLTQTKNQQFPSGFSPDGKRLLFHEEGVETRNDLWTLPIVTDVSGLRAGKPELLLRTPFNEQYASFSPDGRWIAYFSNESGVPQVYVRAFPDKGAKWQVSSTGGSTPRWARNGRELFFAGPDNKIMVVTYAAKGDFFTAEKPRFWSERRLLRGGWDLAPDGKRVAALTQVEGRDKPQNHVTFLMNFADELRRKVPVGK